MHVLDNVQDDEAHSDIGISWLPNGKSFCIHNKKQFTKIVLPKYFNNIQFSSFTRQMRRWGFKAVQGFQRNSASYSHPLFVRGDRQNCRRMCPFDLSVKNDCERPPRQGRVKKTKKVESEVRNLAATNLLALRAGGEMEHHHFPIGLSPRSFETELDERRGNGMIQHAQSQLRRAQFQNLNFQLQADAQRQQAYLEIGRDFNEAFFTHPLARRAPVPVRMPENFVPMMPGNYAVRDMPMTRITTIPTWYSLSFSV